MASLDISMFALRRKAARLADNWRGPLEAIGRSLGAPTLLVDGEASNWLYSQYIVKSQQHAQAKEGTGVA